MCALMRFKRCDALFGRDGKLFSCEVYNFFDVSLLDEKIPGYNTEIVNAIGNKCIKKCLIYQQLECSKYDYRQFLITNSDVEITCSICSIIYRAKQYDDLNYYHVYIYYYVKN